MARPGRVVFAGTDEILDASAVRATGPTSEVIVSRLSAPSASGNQMLLSTPSSASSTGRRQLYTEVNGATSTFVAKSASVLSSGRPSDAGWHAMGARFLLDGGRNGDVRVDGTTVPGVLGTNSRQGIRLGASSSSVPVAIEICEVLVYGSTTTDTWNKVFAHLTATYGLPT